MAGKMKVGVKRQEEPQTATGDERQQLGARVSRDVYKRLKLAAVQTERPVGELVEEALERYLAALEAADRG